MRKRRKYTLRCKTWARCGQTPVLRVPLTRDHLSAISGITPDGWLFMQTQNHAYRSPDVARFLRLLLRKIRGKLLVIWDGSPIHRGQPVKDFLRTGATNRLHLEQLPGYAPELNPDEGIWNYLKRVALATLCCPDLTTLGLALRAPRSASARSARSFRRAFDRPATRLRPSCKRQ